MFLAKKPNNLDGSKFELRVSDDIFDFQNRNFSVVYRLAN